MTHIEFQGVTRRGFYIFTVLTVACDKAKRVIPNLLCSTFRIRGRISLMLFLLSNTVGMEEGLYKGDSWRRQIRGFSLEGR
jgi:hypothetical protein